MPKFTLRFKSPTIDEAKFRSNLQNWSEVTLRETAKAWLKAVVLTVPIYTGTARGTLKPLGRFLRVSVPLGPISNAKDARRTTHKVRGTIYNLGPTAGEAYGQYEFEYGRDKFLFIFHQNLPWAVWNAFGSPAVPEVPSAPWMTFEKGKKAFFGRLQERVQKKLPIVFREVLGFKEIRSG